MNKEKNSRKADYLTVGIIGRPRGNKGELFVEPTSTDLTNLKNAREVHLVEKESGLRHQARVERFWIHNKKSIIKFEGINSIEDAGKFKGYRLELPMDQLKPLEEGEYYVKDLIGLKVKLPSGTRLGKIRDLIPTGGTDVLVVNGARGEIMIPFAEEFVVSLDFRNKEVVMKPPDGLLEIYEI